MVQLGQLMRQNFLEYASYVVMDRAIPDLRDGLKPVQRRVLQTLFRMNDGRKHKVQGVIGRTMAIHPHGDASIGDALVVLANKNYFIERQGNFGNLLTGHSAAAPRYIECRLTQLALDTMFNPALTEFVNSYDGRDQEPVFLPAKLPVLLMLGTEGIAVGMATRILPHNFGELLRAQIDLLEGRESRVLPDFPGGGIMDVSEYNDGLGRVRVRARIEEKDEKTVVIREIPYGTTTESVLNSIETAIEKNQVKIASVSDYTTDRVEIEVTLPRGVYAAEAIPQLYAYTDCEMSVNSNITAILDGRPQEMTVSQVLGFLTDQLLSQIKAELQHELDQLADKQHWLTLEQIFIEKKVYKRIETAKTAQEVRDEVWNGMHVYEALFVRPMVEDDVERLLKIPIRRISAYDRAKNRDEIRDIKAQIKDCKKRLKYLKKTTIGWIQGILDKYADKYPRQTVLEEYEAVDKKAVARADIRMMYDRESGFLGTKVKGDKLDFTMSSFDRVLAISKDGSYRVLGPVDKHLIASPIIHCAPLDLEEGQVFTVVYRDKAKIAYAKKVKILRFIKEKEYRLIKDEGGRVDLLLDHENPGKVHLEFVPAKYQRIREGKYNLNNLDFVGVSARGSRLSPKPVAKVRLMK